MSLILIPTRFEADLFIQALAHAASYEMGHRPAWVGDWEKQTVHVSLIGMGPVHCVEPAREAMRLVKPKRVILAGFGGALDPALKLGDIVIDRGEGKIHTASEVVSTPAAKAVLFAQTGCPVVDMESAPVVEAAAEAGIPLTVIRAISDTATDELPAFLAKGYNRETGKETPLRMAGHMLTHPGDIGRLRRLLKSWGPVREALAEAIAAEL
ncbi:hypothetical protein H5P28_13830 [Ruficoccus amylovorans]|uniref:Nucleoside phosphorylase domain-containing protein n=1 Tax=Ruficoccus amylovorans TaxID=1804625 RepID=A0A842HFP2_9BACT|nr:hypothetical protein [Ruficoccus amylovorans]MBC2595343.1 hypothetical protein [Ruficoccus amylovorans]